MSQLLYPTTVNAVSKQLNANYTNADAVITLTNTTSIQNKPGVCLINRIDVNGTLQSVASWTYIEFTATSGATLTGCTVISGGQDQALGKVVEFISDVTQQQRVLDALANMVLPTTGAIDTTKVLGVETPILTKQTATPANPASGYNKIYFKSDGLAYKLNSSGTEQAIEPNLTTKGDIQTFSTVLARLGVGSNGQRLVAASGETTGLSWQSMTLGYAEVTSNQGSITTIVDLTSLSVTVTVPAGARIKITGFGVMYQAATAGSVAIGIYEGATLLNEAVEQLTTANLQQSMSVFSVLTPSTGSHTYKLRGNAVLGSGAVTLNATATTPAFILVEMI